MPFLPRSSGSRDRTLSSLFLAALLSCLMTAIPAAAAPPPSSDAPHAHSHDHSHDHHHHAEESALREQSSLPGWGWGLLAGYALVIFLSSLGGGAVPGRLSISHIRMQHLISGVSGLMLGIAVFHLFPHAVHHAGENSVDRMCMATMIGIVVIFFLLRAFHFHQHEPISLPATSANSGEVDIFHAAQQIPFAPDGEVCPVPGTCEHGHHHHHAHELSWVGVFLGLGIHTLIDGLALGASVQAELSHDPAVKLAGLGTFAAIALHQPLDSMSFTSLMIAGGWSRWAIRLANVSFAVLCPLGAAIFVVGVSTTGLAESEFVPLALAFSAGVFLCIALSDLLPEIEFHSHNRFTLSLCLILGITLAWGIGFLEPAHVHG